MIMMNSSTPTSGNKQYPKDALVVISMMKDLGITEYEPRTVTQLLEFSSRYVSCVLDDARAFANHAKKKAIDVDDIKLAVMMQLDRVFSSPPPRDLLLEVARTKNNLPLPIIKPHCGIRLPPDRYCFSNCNYKYKSHNSKKNLGKTAFPFTTSQGATIKGGKPAQSSTAVKRPSNLSTVSQTIPGSSNPVIKFTSAGQKIVTKPKVEFGPGTPGIISTTTSPGSIELKNASAIKVEPGTPTMLTTTTSSSSGGIISVTVPSSSTTVQGAGSEPLEGAVVIIEDQNRLKRKREDDDSESPMLQE